MRRTTASIRTWRDANPPKLRLGSDVAHAGFRVSRKAGLGRVKDQLDVSAGVST
jgi:hypothetical protein